MKQISSEEIIEAPNTPQFATRRHRSTGADLKFQTKGNAKLSLNQVAREDRQYDDQIRFVGMKNVLSADIKIYKLEKDVYVKIFDSQSELADAFRAGDISLQELKQRIFD